MYEVLIAHLRECAKLDPSENTYAEAANAIEELQKVLNAVQDAHNEGYDVGYWAGRRDYEPKWIPVTERLPEMNTSCLLYNKYYGPMVGARIDEMRFRIPGSRFPDTPTHWMPLPQPPKEET